MIRSFDFFDTLATRRLLRPEDVFRLVEARLAAEYADAFKGFAATRQRAERAAKEQSLEKRGRWEVTLDDIYDLMRREAPSLPWDHARQCEQHVELLHILPVTQNIERLRRDTRAIIVSDTCHSSEFLAQLLAKAGGDGASNRRIYTSSELGKNKHSAELFRLVAERESIAVHELAHLGDNPYSDVAMAARAGASARHFADSAVTRYEQLLGTVEPPGDLTASLCAGAARAARLARPDEVQGDHRTVWDTGCDVVGPLLFSFTLWVLRSAEAAGIHRLFFLARDGQILHRLAERMVAALGLKVECVYLYASRQALHPPAITDPIREADWEWLFERTTFLSLQTLMNRAALDPADVCSLLRDKLERIPSLDENLDLASRKAIEDAFRGDVRIHALILAAAQRARQTVLAYLRANGFFDAGRRCAIVDIGWNGRLQRSLSRILRTESGNEFQGLIGYYFGLVRRASPDVNDALHAFAFAPEDSTGASLANYRYLIELFCSADHESCIGYRFDESLATVVPKLGEQGLEDGADWGIRIQQQAALTFAAYYLDGCVAEGLQPEVISRQTLVQNTLLFCASPSEAEAEAYGKIAFFEDQTHSRGHELAPVRSSLELVKMALGLAPRPHGNFWGAGTLARRSDPAMRMLRLGYGAYKWMRTA